MFENSYYIDYKKRGIKYGIFVGQCYQRLLFHIINLIASDTNGLTNKNISIKIHGCS